MLDLALLAPERVRRIRREEYERMCELGFFEDERIELLRGVIIEMSPPGGPHEGVAESLNMALVPKVVGRASVRVGAPLAASDYSEPQPDLAVVTAVKHRRTHPETALLIIEISVTSLRKDRFLKPSIYAEAGVPEYWVVNVVEGVVERYADPSPDGYRTKTSVGHGETLELVALPGVRVAVDDFLPRSDDEVGA